MVHVMVSKKATFTPFEYSQYLKSFLVLLSIYSHLLFTSACCKFVSWREIIPSKFTQKISYNPFASSLTSSTLFVLAYLSCWLLIAIWICVVDNLCQISFWNLFCLCSLAFYLTLLSVILSYVMSYSQYSSHGWLLFCVSRPSDYHSHPL